MHMLARAAAAAAGFLCLATTVPADEGHDHEHGQDAMTEAWMKSAIPGKQHEFLARMAGDWKTLTTHYQEGAAGAPSEGTATFVSMMGGRYLRGHYTGTMMGQTFEGMSLEGYDNISGKYWSTWIDSMGTSLFVSHGEMTDDGRTLEHWGSMPNPMGGADCGMHFVTTRESSDKVTMKMYMSMPDSEDETLSMVLTMTRASS
jgi:hypothetical protein